MSVPTTPWVYTDDLWLVVDHAKDDEVVAVYLTEKGARNRATVLGYQEDHGEPVRFQVCKMQND